MVVWPVSAWHFPFLLLIVSLALVTSFRNIWFLKKRSLKDEINAQVKQIIMFVFYKFQYCYLCSLNILFTSWKRSIRLCVRTQYCLFILIFPDLDDLVLPLKRTSFSALLVFVGFCFVLFFPTYICVLCFALFSRSFSSDSSLADSEGSLSGQKSCWFLKYECCFTGDGH